MPCDGRVGCIRRLKKESRLEAGCAHSEVIAPQQQWLRQQLPSLAPRSETSDDSAGVVDWDDFAGAMAPWHGIAGDVPDPDVGWAWRLQCKDAGRGAQAIAIGPKAGTSMASSRTLAVQRAHICGKHSRKAVPGCQFRVLTFRFSATAVFLRTGK
jgi:hypothetical protein